MMRQGKIAVVAGMLALGAAACFNDPTESLRGGPDRIDVSSSSLTINGGDNVTVEIIVRDRQGNSLPVTGVSWASADETIATVVADTFTVPGGAYARGVITGLPTGAGITTITATANGLTADINLLVLPTSFTGTVSNGAGRLLDTIVVNSGAAATFTTAGAAASGVSINGDSAWVVSRTATTIRALPRKAGTGAVTVTNVIIAGVTIPSLTTSGTLAVSNTTTGEAAEPTNDAPGGTTITVTGTTAAAPLVIFGSVIGASGAGVDADDYFQFTTAAAAPLNLRLEFTGTGGGASAANPDLDLLVCNPGCLTGATTVNASGATGVQPELITIASLPAGTYNIYVNGWNTGGERIAYKLRISQ